MNGKHFDKKQKVLKRKVCFVLTILMFILSLIIISNTEDLFAYLISNDSIINEVTLNGIYTVSFNSNDGTGNMNNQVIFNNITTNLNPNTYTKNGYVFDGWNTENDGSGTDYTDGESVTNLGDTTLYAKWIYEIEFDANGGTGTMSNQPMTYNVAANLNSNSFTNGNQSFVGWNTEPDGSGIRYTDGQSVSNLGNTTLYAQWGEPEYWITYSYGDESFTGNNYLNSGISLFSSDNIHRDFEISADVSNFTFLTGQDTNRNVIICNQNESASPWPGFAFHNRDGVLKTQVNCTAVAEAERLWNKQSGNITISREDDKLYQDGTLLLDFANNVTPFNNQLTFGANEDTNGSPRRFSQVDLSNLTVSMKYNYEEYTTLCQNLPTPQKTSYVFDGWYTEPIGGTLITTTAQLEQTGGVLYAHWSTAPTLNIKFNANGGSGSMANQLFYAGISQPLNSNTYTRSGYHFYGWNTKADGTGTLYRDNASISINANTTLYAIWFADEVTEYTASSLTLDGKAASIIDTGVYLFSAQNIHKNFEIYFEISNIESNNNQATLMNTKDESGAPYPGIVYRVDQNKLMLKADSTSSNSKRDDRALDAVQSVRIIRINDVTYYSINDEDYTVLMDFSNIVRKFDEPVAFGGVIKPNGARLRGFKGTLSNVSVKFISDTATLEDYQNALP